MPTETFEVTAAGKSVIKKDPNAILDYTFDWTTWLDLVSDTIASHQVIVPAGMTLVTSTVTGANKKVTAWLSGGTVGQTYQITCRIITNSSPARQDDRSFYAKIVER